MPNTQQNINLADNLAQLTLTEQPEDWTDLDPEFAEEWYDGKTYQQKWEELGFTKTEVQAWLANDFAVADAYFANYWKNHGFTPQQTKEWIASGLDKNNSHWAAYSRSQGYQPRDIKQEKLETEYKKWQQTSSAQEWLDVLYPLSQRGKVTELNISDQNLTGKLDLTDFVSLKELDCRDNQLTELDLTNCQELTNLSCHSNHLTNLNLSQNQELKELDCPKNNLTSLAFVQPLTMLEKLNINRNKITNGLEYLPLSLERLWCDDNKLESELVLYNYDLTLWQETHPQLMKNIGKELVTTNYSYSNAPLKTVITTPEYLTEELTKEIEANTNADLSHLDYTNFLLRDSRSFSWETNLSNSPKSLPLRLYNLKTNQVVNKDNQIKNYLILSYCWGTDWEGQPQSYGQSYQTDLTKLGRKALNKVIKTWQLINHDPATNLNHIWIDNFCINQQDGQEKGQEVANQKQYYSQASATLIAIDAEIGAVNKENEGELTKHIIQQIVTAPWFKRSWTFQEGLLSKQTIFMFDDYLVDGRILAQWWGGIQKDGYLYLETTPTIYTTPLGWSYVAQQGQEVNLSLGQALQAVAHRQQTVPVDGIYSILGLLSYGDKVKANYKSKNCSCDEEVRKNCQHWPTYSQAELEQILLGIIEVAKKNNYPAEVLSWWGERCHKPKLWQIPIVKVDGSTNVAGSSKIEVEPNSLIITPQGIQLLGEKINYSIYLNDELIKTTPLFWILVPDKKKSHQPIKLERHYSTTSKKTPIFIDMLNQQAIAGAEAIQAYQTQLINPHLQAEQEEQFQQEQLIKPLSEITTFQSLWTGLSLYEDQTWNNKNIYEYQEWINYEYQSYYYIFTNNIACQIIESAKGKADWTYLIPQQQAQIEQPPK